MKKNIQHIILVSIDTLRADCISASPRSKDYLKKYKVNTLLDTKVLDDILKSSIYFNNCFSVAPYTSAAHTAYFTGMWPLHNGIYEFFNRKINKPTIFQLAKKKGYTTIFQTDFPVILGPYLGITKGIDHYFIENDIAALKTLKKNKEKKTISFFHFGGVHYPYGFHTLKFGGEDYLNKVRSLEKKYKITHKELNKLNDILDETFRKKKDTEYLLRYKLIVEKLYREKKYDDLFNLYLEGVNYFLKHRLNPFIEEIKRFVDENNAILFLFSDHGEEWDEFSEGHHNSSSDNVLRVPLMIYGNKIKPRVEEGLIRTIDLAPTIVNLFSNLDRKNKMDGSRLNIFNSEKSERSREYAISQVWTSIATKKQIADYQSNRIKNLKLIKPLKTYLSTEVIRVKDGKLVIHYKEDGSILKKEAVIADDKNGILQARLEGILKKYNASKQVRKKQITNIELRIKNELNNLGYKI